MKLMNEYFVILFVKYLKKLQTTTKKDYGTHIWGASS